MWTDEDVLDAASEWVWIPDGAEVVERDYTLVRRPAWAGGRVEVTRIRTVRPAETLLDEVAETARAWGAPAVRWAVPENRPGLVAALESRGAAVVERLDVLARPLADPVALDTERGVSAAVIRNAQQLEAHADINARVWGDPPLAPDRFASELADIRKGIEEGTAFRVLATVDGLPASTGGVTIAHGSRGTVARLWGAATREAARGRGAYRAVLAARLRLAAEAGASLALVKGRVDTSAPILTREGFRRYGGERHFQLPF